MSLPSEMLSFRQLTLPRGPGISHFTQATADSYEAEDMTQSCFLYSLPKMTHLAIYPPPKHISPYYLRFICFYFIDQSLAILFPPCIFLCISLDPIQPQFSLIVTFTS